MGYCTQARGNWWTIGDITTHAVIYFQLVQFLPTSYRWAKFQTPHTHRYRFSQNRITSSLGQSEGSS